MPLQTLTLQPLLQGELRGHITTDTNINERGPPFPGTVNASKERPIFTAEGSQVLQIEMYGYRVRKHDHEVPKLGVMVC